MSTLKEYATYFEPDKVPDALVKLLEFADAQTGFFSQSFEMDGSYFSSSGIRTYSTDPAFIRAFREFAQADGTGSTYALWSQSDNWEIAPVVAFGSEGGAQIVAQNLVELFRILTLDAEPMIDWNHITFYKSKNAQSSDGAEDYAKWLKKTFNVDPFNSAEEVELAIRKAQDAHGSNFSEWMKQYLA